MVGGPYAEAAVEAMDLDTVAAAADMGLEIVQSLSEVVLEGAGRSRASAEGGDNSPSVGLAVQNCCSADEGGAQLGEEGGENKEGGIVRIRCNLDSWVGKSEIQRRSGTSTATSSELETRFAILGSPYPSDG